LPESLKGTKSRASAALEENISQGDGKGKSFEQQKNQGPRGPIASLGLTCRIGRDCRTVGKRLMTAVTLYLENESQDGQSDSSLL
jgi:hypothetical protein